MAGMTPDVERRLEAVEAALNAHLEISADHRSRLDHLDECVDDVKKALRRHVDDVTLWQAKWDRRWLYALIVASGAVGALLGSGYLGWRALLDAVKLVK